MLTSARGRAATVLTLALLLGGLTGCGDAGTPGASTPAPASAPASNPSAPGVDGLLRAVQNARNAQAAQTQDLNRAANSQP